MTHRIKRGPCRHCGRVVVLRARDLCNPHYENLSIRALYSIDARRSARPGASRMRDNGPPEAPTMHCVGTRAKIEEFARRAERGLSLHHPSDKRDLEGATVDELASPPQAGRDLRPVCQTCNTRFKPLEGVRNCPKCRQKKRTYARWRKARAV